jgi:hypothetical protein
MLAKEYDYVAPIHSTEVTQEILRLRLTEDFKERISEDINP